MQLNPASRGRLGIALGALVVLAAVAVFVRISGARSSAVQDPPAWLVQLAQNEARWSGDPSPETAKWALTNQAAAGPAVGTVGGSPDVAEYLVVLTGQFVDNNAHVAPGQPAPEGDALVFTAEPDTQMPLDLGIVTGSVDTSLVGQMYEFSW